MQIKFRNFSSKLIFFLMKTVQTLWSWQIKLKQLGLETHFSLIYALTKTEKTHFMNNWLNTGNQNVKIINQNSKRSARASVLCAEVLVDFGDRNVDGEADEEKLLLLRQPDQLHPHLTVCVPVLHQKVLAAIVEGQLPPCLCDANSWADAPEGFLELVQQSQCHDATVLSDARKNYQRNSWAKMKLDHNVWSLAGWIITASLYDCIQLINNDVMV